MRLIPLQNAQEVGAWVAQRIVNKINQFKPTAERPFLLGLPTGSSPLVMYQQLIKQYQAGKVSFKHVVTFNMDEYVGLNMKKRSNLTVKSIFLLVVLVKMGTLPLMNLVLHFVQEHVLKP